MKRLDVSRLGELGLIEALRQRAGSARETGLVGIGDDAAVLRPSRAADWVSSVDALIEDVHFRWSTSDPRSLGCKALEVNLSDLAAMGARPRGFLLSWALPADAPADAVDGVVSGLLAVARKASCPLLGGDTVAGPCWMLSITVFGEVPRGRALLRSGARVGDRILVTGSLGGAALGLAWLEGKRSRAVRGGRELERELRPFVGRQLRPKARLAEGVCLAETGFVTAAMDLSDGLALDLQRLAEASGVGARVLLDRIPLMRGLRRGCSALSLDAEGLALAGGEDYELLFCVEPDAPTAVEISRQIGCKVSEIGVTTAEPGVCYWRRSGAVVQSWRGYEHFKRIGCKSDK